MMRFLGGVFIIAGCSGIGLWYRGQFYETVRHLRYMQCILELFISEVRYGKATLPECCRQVSEKVSWPYGQALLSVYEEMEKYDGGSFREKWKLHMGQALKKLPLTGPEKDIFLNFCECSGLSDNLMQIRAIEQYRDMLGSAVKNREGNLEKQGRLAAGLGVMGGLLLTVILL